MITEGKGRVAPKAVPVQLDQGECLMLAQQAQRQGATRGYSLTNHTWRNGLCPEMVDPIVGKLPQSVRPIYCGLLGEHAVSLLIRRRTGLDIYPDLTIKPRGDMGVDLTAAGLTLQIKTRQKSQAPNRVKLLSCNGIPVIASADAHVFCLWEGEGKVSVCGWVWTIDLQSHKVVKGKGEWWNVEPEDTDLLPFSRLVDEVRARMMWRK